MSSHCEQDYQWDDIGRECRERFPRLRVRYRHHARRFPKPSERLNVSDDFWDSSNSGAEVDLGAFFDSRVIDELVHVVGMGVLVSVGLTRDRGALGLAIFDNGRRRREYFRDSSEAADFLARAGAALSGNGLGAPAGDRPPSRKPTRGA